VDGAVTVEDCWKVAINSGIMACPARNVVIAGEAQPTKQSMIAACFPVHR